jgi:hypothetical protein
VVRQLTNDLLSSILLVIVVVRKKGLSDEGERVHGTINTHFTSTLYTSSTPPLPTSGLFSTVYLDPGVILKLPQLLLVAVVMAGEGCFH